MLIHWHHSKATTPCASHASYFSKGLLICCPDLDGVSIGFGESASNPMWQACRTLVLYCVPNAAILLQAGIVTLSLTPPYPSVTSYLSVTLHLCLSDWVESLSMQLLLWCYFLLSALCLVLLPVSLSFSNTRKAREKPVHMFPKDRNVYNTKEELDPDGVDDS